MSELPTNLKPHYSNFNPKAFPKINLPKIVGYFSLNEEREYIQNVQNLKYLNLPEMGSSINFNLNEGYEQRISKPECAKDEKIDNLLKFILSKLSTLRNDDVESSRLLKTEFVCFRGLLRLMMCSPYDWKTNWIILATKFKGTIYLLAKETPEDEMRKASETEDQKRFCAYGFKFEQFVLSSNPNENPKTDQPVNEAEEFCTIFETVLEDKRLLYGAEMDGIISSEKIKNINSRVLNTLKFVEVKVTKQETAPRKVQNFYKFKTIKWFCQCFLVNVKEIVIGYRDDKGYVRKIECHEVQELQKKSTDYWNPAVCLEFCSLFLETVKNRLKGVNSPHTVYKFEFDSRKKYNIFFTRHHGPNEDSFLPQWYYRNDFFNYKDE